MLERIAVGAQVIITDANLDAIRTDCYSIAGMFGCNTAYLENFKPLHAGAITGEVTHNFPPGYELSVCFGDHPGHMSYRLGGHHVTVINREAWADERGYVRYAVYFSSGGSEKHQLTTRVPVECAGRELVEILRRSVESAAAMLGMTEYHPQCYEMLPAEGDL